VASPSTTSPSTSASVSGSSIGDSPAAQPRAGGEHPGYPASFPRRRRCGLHHAAGELDLKWVWNTLADVDRSGIVISMVNREEHPSYMRFLRRGETTPSDFWQYICRSKCHDMLGMIYEWFYEAVPEPGSKRRRMRPG
jgi:hypothetical protein